MSRSFKKIPVIKYAPERGKTGKRIANKTVRKARGISDGKSYKKIYEQWNIHDCVDYQSLKEFLKRRENFKKFCEDREYTFDDFYGLTEKDAINIWKKTYIRK